MLDQTNHLQIWKVEDGIYHNLPKEQHVCILNRDLCWSGCTVEIEHLIWVSNLKDWLVSLPTIVYSTSEVLIVLTNHMRWDALARQRLRKQLRMILLYDHMLR